MLRENIISLATANGEGYEPGCGDTVLILAYSSETDSCSVLFNIAGFEYPIKCGLGQTIVKHAWAFPYENSQPVPDMSKRFSWIGKIR